MNTPRPWRKSEGVMNVSGRRYQEMVVLIGNRQRARDGVRAMRPSARRFVTPIGMNEIDPLLCQLCDFLLHRIQRSAKFIFRAALKIQIDRHDPDAFRQETDEFFERTRLLAFDCIRRQRRLAGPLQGKGIGLAGDHEHHLRGFPVATADQNNESATVVELSRPDVRVVLVDWQPAASAVTRAMATSEVELCNAVMGSFPSKR